MEDRFLRHLLLNTPTVFSADDLPWELDHALTSLSTLHQVLREDALLTVDHRRQGISERKPMTLKQFHESLIHQANDESFYAKDIHIQRISSSPCKFPPLFQDDWLDQYYRYNYGNQEDFTFLYIGGPNSFTGLHFDVLCSYSVSYNIRGRKLWKLWPPCSKLHEREDSLSYDRRPSAEVDALDKLSFIQESGETVFVPSGWYHTVENIDPCVISINKNWFESSTRIFIG